MTRRPRAPAASERARRASADRRSLERSRRRLAVRRYLELHPHRIYWQIFALVIVAAPAITALVLAMR